MLYILVILCFGIFGTQCCRICPRDTLGQFCIHETHCGKNRIDVNESGLYHDLMTGLRQLSHGINCRYHHSCYEMGNLHNSQMVEYEDKMYRYLQYDNKCAIVLASDVSCDGYCCRTRFASGTKPSKDTILSVHCAICPRNHQQPYCSQSMHCSHQSEFQIQHHKKDCRNHYQCHTVHGIHNVELHDVANIIYKTFQYDDKCMLINTEDAECVGGCCPSRTVIDVLRTTSSSTKSSTKSITTTHVPITTTSTQVPITSTTVQVPATTLSSKPAHICDKLGVITALANSKIISHHHGLCLDGVHFSPMSAVAELCHTHRSIHWTKGHQVIPNCSNIPQYAAIAAFTNTGYSSSGLAGALISCNSTHIKLAAQDCSTEFVIKEVNIYDNSFYDRNALNYFVIQL